MQDDRQSDDACSIVMDNVLGVPDAIRRRSAQPLGSGARPRVEVAVAREGETSLSSDRIERAVVASLADLPHESAAISVALVDDATIRRLNREFLQHDYATDVLSFALVAGPPELEGEIIVSVETAQRSVASHHWSAEDELLLYIVHGCLHLAGFDDADPSSAAIMRAREAEILGKLGVQLSAHDPRWSQTREENGDQETRET